MKELTIGSDTDSDYELSFSGSHEHQEPLDLHLVGPNEDKIPLTAHLQDDLESNSQGNLVQFNNQKRNISLKIINLIIILVLTIFTIDISVASSCKEKSIMCLPQLRLQVHDESAQGKKTLSTITEGLKMISYMAKDFGVPDESLSSDINYIDTIDTFSTKNIFEFNTNGYCRYNTKTDEQYCSDANGVDVASSVINDIGIQLANYTKHENPAGMGKSLVKTYSHIVALLDALYSQAKGNKIEENSLKMEQLHVAHRLALMESYGKAISKVPTFTLLMSIISTFLLILMRFFFISDKSKYITWLMSSILVMEFSHLALLFNRIVFQSMSFYKLITSLKKLEFANLQFASGYYFLWSMFIINIIVCAVIIRGLRK